MSTTLLTALAGLSLGMRHALEPDHLAAVSTLAAEQRSPRAGLWLGALWGLGHSLSLLVVGGGLALLELHMPEQVTLGFELLVSLVLMVLGARAVRRSILEGRSGAIATHHHGALVHTHSMPGTHVHLRGWTFAGRPLLVGVLHGLAGSGALTAVVLAQLPSAGARLGAIVLFGLGSVVGMAALTGAVGVPLMRMARAPRVASGLLGAAGVVSLVVGLWWAWASGAKLLT
ncbi:MAG: hypothetical protein JNG84_06910 [Archangium sp.]|nr:hypothetical protein [Archangium sp.]